MVLHTGYVSCLYSEVHAQQAIRNPMSVTRMKGMTMFTKRINTMWVLGIALAFVVALGVSSASADSITYDLTVSNLGGGFPGPFLELAIDRTSNTQATITATSLTSGGFTYRFGGNDTLGL